MHRHVALRRLVRSLESNTPNHSTNSPHTYRSPSSFAGPTCLSCHRRCCCIWSLSKLEPLVVFHPLLVILTHSVYTQALAPEAKLSASSISSNHSSHTTSSSPAHHCPPFPCRCAAYEKGGPAAEARFEAGVAGFEARAFRGCGIMTSEPFEVSDGALTRRTTLAL